MVVRVFLVITCFVKIAVCGPYTSKLNNKFPTMTTSYATNILPEEYADNVPYYDDYRPSIPQEMTYPTEEIRLNYPSILSRPMAITPLPMPRDLNAEVSVPEINFPNNGYAPGKSACHKNYNYDYVKPKFVNDIPAPKYQFKPFSESYNAFRENLFKNSELNLRSNAMIPQYNVFDDFGITDNRDCLMCDLDDILSPPLKIPLKPQGPFELPIQKPFIDHNFNTDQDNFDGLENISFKNEIPSPVYPGPSDIFFNQVMTLDDGKFLEGEIQIPGTSTFTHNYNPFTSSLLNQQLLLLNNFAVPEKQSKRTTDLNNLSNFDIDINIAENTCSENIPIEITISDASDILISADNGEASCIIIDICNENSENNECFTNQVQISESDAPPCPLPSEPEKVVVDTQNINSMGFENFSLKDFSMYLAEGILSALQTYASYISSNPKDNKAYEILKCADKTATSFDKSVPLCGPSVSTQPNQSLNTKTKSRDKIKANKTSQTSPVLNNTENKDKAPPNTNKSTDDPTNMTPQTSLPSNKDNKMPEPCSPARTCKTLDKSKDISTDKTSQSSNSIKKTSEVASTITASPITSEGKDMSKVKSSQTLLSSNNINKTSGIASTIDKCPTTSKGKDIYTDKATQTVITSNSTNKTYELVSTTETAPISNKVPQISLPPENKDEISIAKSTIDAYALPNKNTDISTDETTKTSVPPDDTGVMSEASSTSTKMCTSSQTPLPQRDKVAEKLSDAKPKPCISTIKINISPLKDNLQQIVVFV